MRSRGEKPNRRCDAMMLTCSICCSPGARPLGKLCTSQVVILNGVREVQNGGIRRYAQSMWLIGAGGRKVLGKLALFCKKGFCTSRATPGVRAEFPQPARFILTHLADCFHLTQLADSPARFASLHWCARLASSPSVSQCTPFWTRPRGAIGRGLEQSFPSDVFSRPHRRPPAALPTASRPDRPLSRPAKIDLRCLPPNDRATIGV